MLVILKHYLFVCIANTHSIVGCFADVNSDLKIITTMKRLLLLVMALSITTMAMAQKSEPYFSLSGVTKSGANLAKSKSAFALEDTDLILGVHLNDKWAVIVPFTGSLELNTEFQTYTSQLYLGLGGEYTFFNGDFTRYSAYATVQTSLTKRDLGGAMALDFGIKEEFDGVEVSVGLRYLDMYKSYLPNQWYFYASCGFSLFSE